MKASLAILIVLFLATIFIGKQSETVISEAATITEKEQYKLHADSSERLIIIMQGLVPIIKKDMAEGISPSKDDLADMTEAVEELLFYAELMSIKVPATELEENETVIFSAMANQLYDQSLNIQQLTNNYDLQTVDKEQNRLLNSAFERLNRTCAACHQLFRDEPE